ncbi:MAG TPA: RNA polymerase sigma factor RpoH [Burkholderiales bacterium]|nr:RNA polymerase sigma factor RpoH [Burkholderiales bacterium]
MTSQALALPNVSLVLTAPIGSLEAYVERVSAIPMLDREQELALARRFHEHQDLDAARDLVLSHLRFVVHIARGYMGYGLPVGDLIQEGNVGLMKAVKRFDPDMGVRLVSFAVHWIRAEIHEYVIRNWRLVRIATTKAQRKLFFNLRSLKSSLASLGAEDVKAVATKLGVKPDEVVEMETRLTGRDIALEPVGEDEDDAFAPISYLMAEDAEPGRILEHEETARLRSEGLERALNDLDPRSRRIIEARWLTEKDSATLHDLAAEFGVSAERIRQIEAKALARMKGVIGHQAA